MTLHFTWHKWDIWVHAAHMSVHKAHTHATDQCCRRLLAWLPTVHAESSLRPRSTSLARRRAKRRARRSRGHRGGILQKCVACLRSTTGRCTCLRELLLNVFIQGSKLTSRWQTQCGVIITWQNWIRDTEFLLVIRNGKEWDREEDYPPQRNIILCLQ